MSLNRKCLHEEQEPCVHLLFVGSPLLDITVPCDPETLERYHLKDDDCVKATDLHNDLFQELLNDPKSRMDAGGSAFNSAKVAQWMLGNRGRTDFAGCVGEDEYASTLFNDLRSNHVEPLFISLPESPTGVCVCLLSPGGKRSMCTRHGAAALFEKDHLNDRHISRSLKQADCIFVAGYSLVHSPEAVHALVIQCLPSQLFSFSLSAEYVCKNFTRSILDILFRVDILFGNEAEIMAFAHSIAAKESMTTENAASLIATLKPLRPQPRIVVITRGPDSVIVVKGTNVPRHFPVPPITPVVDSVGCGDALAGAFLGAYVLTKDVERAIKAGIQAAVQIAKVPGCELPENKVITF